MGNPAVLSGWVHFQTPAQAPMHVPEFEVPSASFGCNQTFALFEGSGFAFGESVFSQHAPWLWSRRARAEPANSTPSRLLLFRRFPAPAERVASKRYPPIRLKADLADALFSLPSRAGVLCIVAGECKKPRPSPGKRFRVVGSMEAGERGRLMGLRSALCQGHYED